MNWREEWLKRDKVPSLSNQASFAVLANIYLQPRDRVLIVGCGDGGLARFLKGKKTGLDINAGLNENKRLNVVSGDACLLPFEDKTFDVVVLNSVLHYLRGYREVDVALREADRVARRVVVLGDLVHPFERSGSYCKLPPGFFLAKGFTVIKQSWNNRRFAVKQVGCF